MSSQQWLALLERVSEGIGGWIPCAVPLIGYQFESHLPFPSLTHGFFSRYHVFLTHKNPTHEKSSENTKLNICIHYKYRECTWSIFETVLLATLWTLELIISTSDDVSPSACVSLKPGKYTNSFAKTTEILWLNNFPIYKTELNLAPTKINLVRGKSRFWIHSNQKQMKYQATTSHYYCYTQFIAAEVADIYVHFLWVDVCVVPMVSRAALLYVVRDLFCYVVRWDLL